MKFDQIRDFLEVKVREYNQPGFIKDDPISIPHRFSKKQDIEIAGLWAAVLAWGIRSTIIRKCTELFELMDNAPHDFMVNHNESDLKMLLNFKHRTFNATDTLYFIEFFNHYYSRHDSMEDAFYSPQGIEEGLRNFHDTFFSLPEFPERTKKAHSHPRAKLGMQASEYVSEMDGKRR